MIKENIICSELLMFMHFAVLIEVKANITANSEIYRNIFIGEQKSLGFAWQYLGDLKNFEYYYLNEIYFNNKYYIDTRNKFYNMKRKRFYFY